MGPAAPDQLAAARARARTAATRLTAPVRHARHGAARYVTNSLYPICIAGALRIFKREQFLFLRFEDLMRMKAPALLHLLSNFTGLYTDPEIVQLVRGKRECEAGLAKKVPLSFTKKGEDSQARRAKDDLKKSIPDLERFYAPYSAMLQELVHPAFVWGPETHMT